MDVFLIKDARKNINEVKFALVEPRYIVKKVSDFENMVFSIFYHLRFDAPKFKIMRKSFGSKYLIFSFRKIVTSQIRL
tara:strand:- start:24576 stop:24809 length:234 start_codon:yes stop_codon:yes gene_type:complete